MTNLEKDIANTAVIGQVIDTWRQMDGLIAALDTSTENGRSMMLLMREHQSLIERHWNAFVLPLLRRIEQQQAEKQAQDDNQAMADRMAAEAEAVE